MNRILSLLTMVGLFGLAPTLCQAQELLTNGNLNQVDEDGNPNPALYYNEPVAWDIVTDPCSYSPCAISPYVPGAFYTQYSGYVAGFADRSNPGAAGNSGLIGTSFEGYYPFEIVGARRYEDSANGAGHSRPRVSVCGLGPFRRRLCRRCGVPGFALAESAERRRSGGQSRGARGVADRHVLRLGVSRRRGQRAAEFDQLATNFTMMAGSRIDNQLDGRTWMQHVLKAVAPAGTVSVRVSAGMVDGEFNIDAPHQSVFFDDFSLTAVPEPTSGLLAAVRPVVDGIRSSQAISKQR